MSPPSSHTLAQLAEIRSLNIRLFAAKSNRAPQMEAVNRLKTRQANEYAILCRLGDEIDRKNREAQFAYSINEWKEYGQICEEMKDIESHKALAVREWTDLGNQIQTACAELSVLDNEISELERTLNARNAL